MHRKYLIIPALLFIGATPSFASSPACRSKMVVNANEEVKVVVPFAVPVGVPVATFAPYFYSAPQWSVDSGRWSEQDKYKPSRSDDTSLTTDNRPQTTAPASVATRCVTCHGGPNPKAGFSLASVETLSAGDRLNAIRAVVSGKMPKGGKLTGEEVRAIVDELAKTPANISTQTER